MEFLERLESKVRQQVRGKRCAYLLGAGASYLGGQGYPLAGQLWPRIRTRVAEPFVGDIDRELSSGAAGLEDALDRIDVGQHADGPHRSAVTLALRETFREMEPQLGAHEAFARAINRRTEPSVPIFTLNYDPLLERAFEAVGGLAKDGFRGFEHAYFDPAQFQMREGMVGGALRFRAFRDRTGIAHIYKLHGSLGWYNCPTRGIRRTGYDRSLPDGTSALMIPPQYRKAQDTATVPYSALWSDFRGLLTQGPLLVNRLVTIGYGFLDNHVNAVIENSLARSNMTLVVVARSLTDDAFARLARHCNAIVVTAARSSLYGVQGSGHSTWWDFEAIAREVM